MKPLKKNNIFNYYYFLFKRNIFFKFLPNIGIQEAIKKQTAEPNIVLKNIVKK